MKAGKAALLAALGVAALGFALVPAAGQGGTRHASYRSGNPPVVTAASIDAQRRLVVTWNAPDGMTYGGSIYLDNDPANATPVSSGKYGTLMYCNNKSTCKGRWRLDANPGTGPFTYTTESLDAARFPAGTYYMQVEGYNEDPFPSTRLWEWSNIVQLTIPAADTTPPETTIAGGPTGTVAATTASFTFTANESGSTFECRLDGAAFAPCTSPKEYAGLAGGAHTFDVRATDSAKNVDASPASRTWTIDATAPDTTITDGPTGTVTSGSARFSFSSSEQGATFECRLDGATFGACTSPKAYNALAAGAHTFEVRATDAAGNVDQTPASRTWTVRAAPSAQANPPRRGRPAAQPREKKVPRLVEPPDDNKTPACGKAIARIDLLNAEMKKAVDNWNFENRVNRNADVQKTRDAQLDRRIKALARQQEDALNDAERACGAEWGGIWTGKGTVASSKCADRSPAKITLTIDQNAKRQTMDTLLSFELDRKCPADAFPALLRNGGKDLDLGVTRVTGKSVESVTGGVFSLTKTGADSLSGKIERTIAGIKLTLEFTAKRG